MCQVYPVAGYLSDVKIDDPRATIDATRGKSYLLKVGKRRFARVTFSDSGSGS